MTWPSEVMALLSTTSVRKFKDPLEKHVTGDS